MASTLDNAVLVGKESVYGTAATLTRGYEAKADTWKRSQEFLEAGGIRAGRQAQRSDRSIPVAMGGEGSIQIDALNTGLGLLLQSCLGTASGPTQIGATDAYTQTYESAADETGDSYTVQVLRTDVGGTTRAFTHKGCTTTGWTLSQDTSGLLGLELKFDFQDVVTDVTAGTPVYPAGAPFTWAMASATWNGSAIDLRSFSFDANLNLDVDRRFLRASHLKKQPKRKGVPEFTGSAEMEFESMAQYDAFVAGTVAPLVITWTGAAIDTENFELSLELPAIQFTGSSPEVATDALPKLELPYKALHGADPAVTLTYVSTDTAL